MRRLVQKGLLSLLFASSSLYAADDKVVFTANHWKVMQSIDAMTDKKSCTAIYKDSWTIQGEDKSFYISMKGRGGLKAYKFRVGDSEPTEMRLATDMEQKVSTVIFDSDFPAIYDAKRLRVQVVTHLSSVVNEDIDLNGLKESVDYMRANGC